ncbi:Uncharacterized protein TCM_041644 [Theobroma cacao]|uniref:Uncharacterized protein n=1 Tax=Theobroma cacao TaxID=3641 RepID=A0A061GV95_THECC|nr:Uncharacterized protein TCM_041644 [Theobroma cacao]
MLMADMFQAERWQSEGLIRKLDEAWYSYIAGSRYGSFLAGLQSDKLNPNRRRALKQSNQKITRCWINNRMQADKGPEHSERIIFNQVAKDPSSSLPMTISKFICLCLFGAVEITFQVDFRIVRFYSTASWSCVLR